FISLDCGIADDASYMDQTMGISYIPDTNFAETGENFNASLEYKLQTKIRQFWNVRSLPNGARNCCTLNPIQGKTFDLYLGVDFRDTVNLEFAGTLMDKDIIHVSTSDYIYVFVVRSKKPI
ncbi:Malectin-like carbohydrate-binding domain containing protein, partial [Parasponia andersonii]